MLFSLTPLAVARTRTFTRRGRGHWVERGRPVTVRRPGFGVGGFATGGFVVLGTGGDVDVSPACPRSAAAP